MIYTSQPDMDKKEQQAILEVIKNNDMLVGGRQVEQFEKEYAKYIGTQYAIAVNSGTAALTIAIRTLDIKEEIITTPVSFVATPESILLAGAKPSFIDIDRNTWNINPYDFEDSITDDTKAIIPVHLYGLPCDMDRIKKIAYENDLYVIEDACQAHGATYKNKKVGSIGDIGCWSFYATKNMTTGGNGGMITTDNKEIYEQAKLLREHGGANQATMIGYNARMNTINAAIGRIQLKKLDFFNMCRNTIAKFYYNNLTDLDIGFPIDQYGRVMHLFVIEIKNRNKIKQQLAKHGIICGVHYPKPLHMLDPYMGMEIMDLPNAEKHCMLNLSLPCHSKMTMKDAEKVVKCLKEVVK